MFLSTLFEGDIQQESNYILWGTPAPIMLMINSQKISLVAKGSCSFEVIDEKVFTEVVGTRDNTDGFARPFIIQSLTDELAEYAMKIASIDELEENIDELATAVKDRLQGILKEKGIELTTFKIHTMGFN